MFDQPIEDMREGISDNAQGTFWARYIIPKQLIAYGAAFGDASDADQMLAAAWVEG